MSRPLRGARRTTRPPLHKTTLALNAWHWQRLSQEDYERSRYLRWVEHHTAAAFQVAAAERAAKARRYLFALLERMR